MPHMSTAASPRAWRLFAALCCAAAGCQSLDDDESRDCTLQQTYEASFTRRSSGGGCTPETQALRVQGPETLETFVDKKVETVSVQDGCTLQLLVTTRDRFSAALISQLSGSAVPAADGNLRGLFTFTVFDAQGMTTCRDTVDATLAPWFTSNAALPAAR